MNIELERILLKHNLDIYNADGSEKSFVEVLEQIYLYYNMKEFQDMMTEILDLEEKLNIDPFRR